MSNLIEAGAAVERRNQGLVILEAYYGLDEHIYQIDAGLLLFKEPKTVEEYINAQIIPVKRTLTYMVQDS